MLKRCCRKYCDIITKINKFLNTELESGSESELGSDIELELKCESRPDTE